MKRKRVFGIVIVVCLLAVVWLSLSQAQSEIPPLPPDKGLSSCMI